MKKIALTMRITEAVDYTEPRDSISHDWIARLEAWELLPHALFNTSKNAGSHLKSLNPDLIILTGGDDIGAYPLRDNAETNYLECAIDLCIPVLGVCRGMQIINQHFGGSLSPLQNHVNTRHDIFIDQKWQDIYPPVTSVNSFHNLGISNHNLADSLLPMAADIGGCIESFVHPDLQIAAVMWHPERAGAPPQDRKLLNRLISGDLHSYD